jgi:hypothetical protein
MNAKYSHFLPLQKIFGHSGIDPILQGNIFRSAVEIDSFGYAAAVHSPDKGFDEPASS